MTIFTKILAVLNLLAAGVLVVFAVMAFTARIAWNRVLAEHQRALQGTLTASDALAQLTPEQRTRVAQYLSDPARRHGAGGALAAPLLEDKMKLLSPEAQQLLAKMGPDQFSAVLQELVRGRGAELAQRYPNNPAIQELVSLSENGQLLSPAAQQLTQQFGPDDVKRLIQEANRYQTPQLTGEERRLAATRASLLHMKYVYDTQIAEMNADIARYAERLKMETALLTKVQGENTARLRELAALYAELEEMMAARNQAENREKDMRDLLAETRQRYFELARENQALRDRLLREEGIAVGPND
jgi:hypothetical protein